MAGRFARVLVGLSIGVGATCAAALAADPPAATRPAKRPIQAIMADVQAAGAALSQVNPTELLDEAKRKELAPKVLPTFKKMAGLADEIINSDEPGAKQQGMMMKGQLSSFLVVLGDKETTDQLEKLSNSSDAAEAVGAKADLLIAHWLLASKDAPAQEKLAAEAESLAKANPTDNHLTMSLIGMSQIGASNNAMTEKMETIITGMKSEAAQAASAGIQGRRKLQGLENKPLVIQGARNTGGNFSTETWKGKVILVDFWATWCGPCLAELPRVKKAYATWHEKGLEVLGVSCDNAGNDLAEFLKKNPDMPWPQLFDEKTAGWHPIATGFGITGIPTMFLIDKKGVVRSVSARENFEEMIPKLLEEK